jgi:ornithine carbamoyltransferase
MILRLESKETGEFLCELDIKDEDIEGLIQYSLSLKKKKYKMPLKDKDMAELIEYALVSILREKMNENKRSK